MVISVVRCYIWEAEVETPPVVALDWLHLDWEFMILCLVCEPVHRRASQGLCPEPAEENSIIVRHRDYLAEQNKLSHRCAANHSFS